MGVASNRRAAIELERNLEEIKTITVQRETELRVTGIINTYDKTGKESLLVTLKANDNIGTIKCEIPTYYRDKITEESILKAKVRITYIKDLYELMDNSVYEFNSDYRIISNLDFMFSDDIVSSDDIKSTNNKDNIDKLKKRYITYMEEYSKENIASYMNGIITFTIIALAFIYIRNEIFLKKE